ncbi:hypothetical protein AX14_009008 [Amanita brunnescens Koide BX004]|nr:hypothetical protein AX14_009008 [Amanita brunnescens Koide BX004]
MEAMAKKRMRNPSSKLTSANNMAEPAIADHHAFANAARNHTQSQVMQPSLPAAVLPPAPPEPPALDSTSTNAQPKLTGLPRADEQSNGKQTFLNQNDLFYSPVICRTGA